MPQAGCTRESICPAMTVGDLRGSSAPKEVNNMSSLVAEGSNIVLNNKGFRDYGMILSRELYMPVST